MVNDFILFFCSCFGVSYKLFKRIEENNRKKSKEITEGKCFGYFVTKPFVMV